MAASARPNGSIRLGSGGCRPSSRPASFGSRGGFIWISWSEIAVLTSPQNTHTHDALCSHAPAPTSDVHALAMPGDRAPRPGVAEQALSVPRSGALFRFIPPPGISASRVSVQISTNLDTSPSTVWGASAGTGSPIVMVPRDRGRIRLRRRQPRQQPFRRGSSRPSIRPATAASVRPRGGCCPAAKRMPPGRQAAAGADAAWVRAAAARPLARSAAAAAAGQQPGSRLD